MIKRRETSVSLRVGYPPHLVDGVCLGECDLVATLLQAALSTL